MAYPENHRTDALSRGSPPPVALHKCIVESGDVDQHAGNLTNWLQEYDQLGEGVFYGRLEELAFDKLQVFKEHTSRALRQDCNVWPNALWLGIPANRQPCRIDGQSVQGNQIMCRPGSCDFELVTPECFDILGIVVDLDLLRGMAAVQGMDVSACRLTEPRLMLSEATLSGLRYVIERLIHSELATAASRLSQDLVMMALLQVLEEQTPCQQNVPSYAHRKAVVDRVKSHLRENGEAPVTMIELCELTHVSRRTLQYSFESILGISPLRYLRVTRLNRVRRALMAVEENTITVTQVCAQWGFWHLGQFARDYKQLFGECPSETLRRKSPQTEHSI